MQSRKAKIVQGGRLILPADFRRELDLRDGDTVTVSLDDGELRISNSHAALKRLQEELRRYVPEGVSLVDELIAERRAEAARE